jgi:MOSC domain-containing protein YiiM
MQNVRVPSPELPGLQRSVVACLASILELDPADVPAPPADHPDPWTVWRNWLARRGLGLVGVHEPSGFEWPGPWLALLRSDDGGHVAAVAFGAPPGIAWNPLGGPETFGDVEAGYVIAPADAALWKRIEVPTGRDSGRVQAIVIASEAEAPVVVVGEAVAHAGRGLEGDRYHEQRGTFTHPHARGHDLTLIEAEALEGLAIAPPDARRNVVTRGIDLNALVGKRFLVGGVECMGQRLCEPCAHLQRLTYPGTLRELVHRGGLRADVLTDGVIRVGDPVRALPATG